MIKSTLHILFSDECMTQTVIIYNILCVIVINYDSSAEKPITLQKTLHII